MAGRIETFSLLRTLTIVLLNIEGVTSVQCTAYENEGPTTFTCPVACCVNSRKKECCNSSQVWNVVLAVIGCVVVLGCIAVVLIFWVKSCINRGRKSRVIHPLSPHSMTMPEPPPYSAPGHDPPPYSSAPPSPVPLGDPTYPPPPFTPRHPGTGTGSSGLVQPVFHHFTTGPSGPPTNNFNIGSSQNVELNSVTIVQPVSGDIESPPETVGNQESSLNTNFRNNAQQNIELNFVTGGQPVSDDIGSPPETVGSQESSPNNTFSNNAQGDMELDSVALVQNVTDDSGYPSETVISMESSATDISNIDESLKMEHNFVTVEQPVIRITGSSSETMDSQEPSTIDN